MLRPIHNRMPVILPREKEGFWLDGSVSDPAALADILGPYPADAMAANEVSSLVNSYANDEPDVVEPVVRNRCLQTGSRRVRSRNNRQSKVYQMLRGRLL